MVNVRKILSVCFVSFCISQVVQAYPIYYSRLKNPKTNQRVHLIGDVHIHTNLNKPYSISENELLNSLKRIAGSSEVSSRLIVEYEPSSLMFTKDELESAGIAELFITADNLCITKLFIRDLYKELEIYKNSLPKDNKFSLEFVKRNKEAFYLFLTYISRTRLIANFLDKDNLIRLKLDLILDCLEKVYRSEYVINIIKEIKSLLTSEILNAQQVEKFNSLILKIGVFTLDEEVISKLNESCEDHIILYLGASHSEHIARLLIENGFTEELEKNNMSKEMIDGFYNDQYSVYGSEVETFMLLPWWYRLSYKFWSEFEKSVLNSNSQSSAA